MTREQYDEFSAPLVRTINDMEDEILRIVAAQLARDGDFSDTSKWRIRQLARSGELGKEAAELIASYSGAEMGEAMEAIEAAALTEIGYVDGAVADLARRGLFDSAVEIPAESSAMNAVRAFKRQAKSDLNLVNTVMMYKAKSSYVNAVNKVYFESEKSRQQALNTMGKYSAGNVMGHFSLQESTRRCIRELAEKGIPAFVDKRGREWSPESYVMMDMRSTLGNTARAAQNMRCDEYGIKLVEISSHLGARPLCAPYQGRIFSRDGSRGVTTDGNGNKIPYSPLSETSYGEPGGLFGINCGHVQYPFFPGCSFQSYFPYPEEENAERYKQFQKQRYMERKIRATKRECMMFNETGDTEAFKEASVRLKQQRKDYRDYSQSAGLKVHNDRTQVYGFDRSVSSKATWAERKSSGKPLTGAANGGIMNVSIRAPEAPQILTDFIANKAVLNDRKYYEKYRGVTSGGKFKNDKKVANYAKKCILENNGKMTEWAYVIDASTTKPIDNCPFILPEGGGNVIFDFNKYKHNSLILVHNHPNNAPFSFNDFTYINDHPQIKTIIAAGHGGTVYKLSPGNGKRLDLSDDKEYQYYQNKWGRFYSLEEADLPSVKEFAKELGWEFSYE